jgi:hypothetical protein
MYERKSEDFRRNQELYRSERAEAGQRHIVFHPCDHHHACPEPASNLWLALVCTGQSQAYGRPCVNSGSSLRASNTLPGAASGREFDLVLFWCLDRFSRERVLETLQYLLRLTAYGVEYRRYTEQYLGSCGMSRDAVISILAIIAKQERVRLSERTVAGRQRARSKDRIGGRPRIAEHKSIKISEMRAGKTPSQPS